MTAPALELADIFRIHGPAYIEAFGPSLSAGQKKALSDIAVCRTAALGGHVEQCDRCGHRTIAYCSCRNRHCPKCQSATRAAWLEQRAAELLPVEYFHVVFTLPQMVAPLALQNQRIVYGMLFRAAAETLLQIAADPKHLGARIGFVAVLHTWGQNLHHHPHLHCVVPGGGIAPDRSRWIACRRQFLLPVKVLSRLFRAKFANYLRRAFDHAELSFHGQLQPLVQKHNFITWLNRIVQSEWVVYAKPPFGGTAPSPEVPGALYPSRGDRQPAPGCASRWSRELSLEGLYARQPARHHGAADDRVHSSLSNPRAAARLCEDPPLWLPC